MVVQCINVREGKSKSGLYFYFKAALQCSMDFSRLYLKLQFFSSDFSAAWCSAQLLKSINAKVEFRWEMPQRLLQLDALCILCSMYLHTAQKRWQNVAMVVLLYSWHFKFLKKNLIDFFMN